jgi:mono/diheme cytochrome c family protein
MIGTLLLTGCGERPPVALKPLKKKEPKETIAAEVLVALGARLYEHNCASCHKADGNGVPGLQPSLIASPLIRSSSENLIRSILQGTDFLEGHPLARHESAGDVMPPHDHFTDLEIAALATYLRTNFENAGPIVQPHEVSALRTPSEENL